MLVSILYAAFSGSLTLANKKIFTEYEELSPICLLMVQCTINFALSTLMMLYKERDLTAFHSLAKRGFVIPPFSEVADNFRFGFKAGALYLMTVLFGLYALKFTSIPL